MQTRDALRVYSKGARHTEALGPLAAHADRLLAAFDAREAARMDDAEARADQQGMQAPLAILERLVKRQAGAAVTDCRLPAIMTFDAYNLMDAAWHKNPDDTGLRRASLLLKNRWMQEGNGLGVMSVGDLAQLRAHIHTQYPKSRVAHIINTEVPKFGFQTLDMQRLVRLASHVTDQDSYERVVEANGLDQPGAERARAMLRALAALGDGDDAAAAPPMLGSADVHERIAARLAAGDDPMADVMPEDEMPLGTDDAPLDDGMGEEELPHDEGSENMETIDSPITGEPLVLELGLAEEDEDAMMGDASDAGAPDDMGPGDDDAFMGPPPKLEGFEPVGQLQDTVTMLEDPSAPGQMLEVTLHPIQEEGASGAGALDDADGGEPMLELGPGPDESMGGAGGEGDGMLDLEGGVDMCAEHKCSRTACEGMLHKHAKSPPSAKSKRMVEHISDSYEEAGDDPKAAKSKAEGTTWKKWNKDHGKRPKKAYHVLAVTMGETKVIDRFTASGLPAALAHVASFGVDGELYVNPSEGSAFIDNVVGAETRTQLYIIAKDRKALPGAAKAFAPKVNNGSAPVQSYASDTVKPGAGAKVLRGALSRADVAHVAELLGLTAASVEARLLNGEELQAEGYRIAINKADELEFGVIGGRARIAGLAALDEVVGHFQASVAASAVSGADTAFRGVVAHLRPLFQVKCAKCSCVDEFVMPDEPAATACSTCKHTTSAQHVAMQLEAAGGVLKDFVILLEVPGSEALTSAQRRLRTERMKVAVSKVSRRAEFDEVDTKTLGITLRGADERVLHAVENVLRTSFGVRELAAAVVPPMPGASPGAAPPGAGAAPGASPFVGAPPTAQQPAGQPMAPQNQPQQTSQTGGAEQKRFITEHTNPLDPNKSKLGQMMPAAGPDDDGAGADDMGGDLGVEDDALPGLPGMSDMPGGGGGAAMPMAPSMMGGGLDEAPRELSDAEREAIQSGLQYYHQKDPYAGEISLGTMLKKDYDAILTRIAPEKSPGRRVLEQTIGEMIREVLTRPVLMFAGALPEPSHINTQQDDWVQVSDDLHGESEDEELPDPPVNNGHAPVQTSAPRPGDLGLDSESRDVGAFGAPTPSPTGHAHVTTYLRGKPKNLGPDTGSGENAMTRKMEEVSNKADKALRSAQRRRR